MCCRIFNTPNLESIMAVIGAAEELNVPVIIMHAEVHEPMMPISVIGPIMIERAKAAKVRYVFTWIMAKHLHILTRH